MRPWRRRRNHKGDMKDRNPKHTPGSIMVILEEKDQGSTKSGKAGGKGSSKPICGESL